MLLLPSSSSSSTLLQIELENKCVCNWTFPRSLYFLRCCVGGFGLLYNINGYFCFWFRKSETYVDQNHFELPSALDLIGSDLEQRRPLSQFYHFNIMRLLVKIGTIDTWRLRWDDFNLFFSWESGNRVLRKSIFILMRFSQRQAQVLRFLCGKYMIVSNIFILMAWQTKNV